ncbi:unnamed protein product [Symbiodinium microadriaticum]|nr:unnamed protein product [Symbiodinium microadriaticum]
MATAKEIAGNVRDRLTFAGASLRLPGREALAGKRGRSILAIIVGFLLLYYPLGAAFKHTIDDNPTFKPDTNYLAGQSRAVAMAAALIDREVNQHGWVRNDPFFIPAVVLDNMPNYQQGIISALGRFAFELTDQVGRQRGSSQADEDLQSASGLLQYAGDVWHWDPTVSLAPTATSEAQYKKARRALLSYNERLAQGSAVFDRRSDNFLATLDRIALDLGSSSAVIDKHLEGGGVLIDTEADDLFYSVKGQLYAYYMIMKALGQDFSQVISEKGLEGPWTQMLDSLEEAAMLQPFVVVNGNPDGQFLPSHLAAQGFYLLRARTQLREITNILLK